MHYERSRCSALLSAANTLLWQATDPRQVSADWIPHLHRI